MRLLYSRHYIGRVIFILEVQDKIVVVYRSSGRSGTGHESDIIPFFMLSERNTFSVPLGYLFKQVYYNGRFENHKKYFWGEQKEFLNNLKEFLKNENPEKHDEITTMEEYRTLVKKINNEMEKICKDREFFDYKSLEK